MKFLSDYFYMLITAHFNHDPQAKHFWRKTCFRIRYKKRPTHLICTKLVFCQLQLQEVFERQKHMYHITCTMKWETAWQWRWFSPALLTTCWQCKFLISNIIIFNRYRYFSACLQIFLQCSPGRLLRVRYLLNKI